MVRIVGKVNYVSEVKTAGEKKLVQITLIQSDPGYHPEIIDLTCWSDSKCFNDAVSLGAGQEVEILANVACEKKAEKYTGKVRYYPISINC